jgi:catechol 2,3-dioxygenase-like lactoylglutathione lyase family enzyme
MNAMKAGATIDRIDHIVFTVRDLDATCAFYEAVLGMTVATFEAEGTMRKALHFGQQKINLHQAGREFEPNAPRAAPGAIDICFVAAEPLDAIIARLRASGVAIELGPCERSGALGPMRSIYLRDPDDNLVEISAYDG